MSILLSPFSFALLSPPLIESIHFPNFTISSCSANTIYAPKLIFTVSLDIMQFSYRMGELIEETTISCLDLFLITGSVCLKSPPKTIMIPPNCWYLLWWSIFTWCYVLHGQLLKNNSGASLMHHPKLISLIDKVVFP